MTEELRIDEKQVKSAGELLKDKDWRIDNLYYIVDTKGRFVKFKRNRVQRHFNKHKHTKNIIGKSRQHGFTTDEAIDCLDQAIFGENENIMIIAHIKDVAEDIFQAKIQRAWEALSPEIKKLLKVRSMTAGSIELDNGMGVNRLAVGMSGIGSTLTRAHITELSYSDVHDPARANNVIRGVIAAGKFGRIDIESTGRGDSGYFYDYFMAASDETPISGGQFKRFFYNWQWDDVKMDAITDAQIKHFTSGEVDQYDKFIEYQEKHKLSDKEITAYYGFWIEYGKNWDLLHSEFPTTIDEMFSSGKDRLFSGVSLDKQEEKRYEKVGHWYYFHKYEHGHKYCIGVDVSEGIGRDSSTIVVLDVTDNKVCATYANDSVEPTKLAYPILAAANKYGRPLVSVERNNHGHATLGKLREIYDEDRIYKMKNKGKRRDEYTRRFGWLTGSNKPTMMYDLADAIDEPNIELSDARLILECRMFTTDNALKKQPKEGQTNHFDILMATTIAWQTRVEALALKLSQPEYSSDLTEELKRLQAQQFKR